MRVNHTVEVGLGTVEFSVPAGTVMSGFVGRTSPSTGTNDVLSARTILFDKKVGYLAFDVCALHEETCEYMRLVSQSMGLSDLVVTATHTHSGPCVSFDRLGPHDPDAYKAMLAAGAMSIRMALENSQLCSGKWIEEFGFDIAFDRREGRPLDIPLRALLFTSSDGTVAGVLATFACHPVVLDRHNTKISADYPGYFRRAVERAYVGSVCIFLTGAAGEINTGHSSYSSIAGEASRSRSFARARTIGEGLATAIAEDSSEATALGDPRFSYSTVEIEVDSSGRDERSRRWKGRISVLNLNQLVIVALPGEPFYSWARTIEEMLTSKKIMTIGYADGVPGYFPSVGAYTVGGYEVDEAHHYYGQPGQFSPECSKILLEGVRRAFETLCLVPPVRTAWTNELKCEQS